MAQARAYGMQGVSDLDCQNGSVAMMNWDGVYGGSMMAGMGLSGLLVLVFLVLGIAAFVIYLLK